MQAVLGAFALLPIQCTFKGVPNITASNVVYSVNS